VSLTESSAAGVVSFWLSVAVTLLKGGRGKSCISLKAINEDDASTEALLVSFTESGAASSLFTPLKSPKSSSNSSCSVAWCSFVTDEPPRGGSGAS